jgi:hypothetical protein
LIFYFSVNPSRALRDGKQERQKISKIKRSSDVVSAVADRGTF